MADVEDRLLVRMEASLAKFERQMERARKAGIGAATSNEKRFDAMGKRMASSAARAAETLGRALDRAEAGYKSVAAAVDPAAAAAQRLASQEDHLAEALKRGVISAAEHARVLALVKAEYAQTIAAMDPAVRKLEEQAQEAARASAAYRGLIGSLDPAAAASQRLAAQEAVLSRALEAGAIDAAEHARAMQLVKAEYVSAAELAARRSQTVATGIGRILNVSSAGRFVLQNTASQLGDIAVQLEGGTSPSRVMAQQLPQVFGGFSALGGALGIVAPLLGTIAAVGIPLVTMLMSAGDASEDTAKKVKTFEDKLSEATGAIERAEKAAKMASAGGIVDLAEAYGDVTERIKELAEALADIEKRAAEVKIGVVLDDALGDKLRKAVESAMGSVDVAIVSSGAPEIEAAAEELRKAEVAVQNAIDQGLTPSPDAVALVEQLRQEYAALTGDMEHAGSLVDQLDLPPEVITGLRDARAAIDAAVEAGDFDAIAASLSDFRQRLEQTGVTIDQDVIDKLVQAQDAAEKMSKGLGPDAEANRVLNEYAQKTAKLKKLTEDLAVAEQARADASADGDHERVAQAREAEVAIRRQIDETIGATDKLNEMKDTLDELTAAMDLVDFDGEGEVRAKVEAFQKVIADALAGVDQLNEADLSALEDAFKGVIGFANGFLRSIGLAADKLANFSKDAGSFEADFIARRASGAGSRDEELVRAVTALAERSGLAAKDLLTVMSYETGGTFDPSVTNATGHTGLIQFSRENQQRYGVNASSSVTEQVIAAGRYLQDAGVKAGDGLLQIYAAINAGDPSKIYASDAGNGGAPGTVLDKVTGQMAGHQNRAQGLLAAYGGVAQETTAGVKAAESERVKALKEEAAAREKLKGLREDLREASKQALEDQQMENTLIGKTAAEQARLRAEYMLTQQAKRNGIDLNERIAGSEQTYGEMIKQTAAAIGESVAEEERLNRARDQSAQKTEFMRQVQDDLKSGLLDAIVAGESFAHTLRNVAQMLARAALQAALFGSGPFGGKGPGLLGGLLGAFGGGGKVAASAKGNVFSGGRIVPFANGGVVSNPTYFPMAGGRTGLMGEAGTEGIFPLARINGKLGVRAETRGGPQTVVSRFEVIPAEGSAFTARVQQSNAPAMAAAMKSQRHHAAAMQQDLALRRG